MTAIRKPGKINQDTTLIDIEMMGTPGVTAMYLIESGKKCLIDGGTSAEARSLMKKLEKLNAFPPDKIILTHSHWDHTQAIPFFRKKAAKLGKAIEILASEAAIPNLKDQSFNEVFGLGSSKNIEDVIPLKEGDIVDLDGITLKIIEVPGHINDHIAILDEKNKNMFVGDAIGDKVADNIFVPPFMPPYWDEEAFLNSINKLKNIKYDTLCLAHFGYIYNDEAKSILDEAVSVYKRWWNVFEENIDKLDDTAYMIDVITKKILSKSETERFGETLIQGLTSWLGMGFKMYKKKKR